MIRNISEFISKKSTLTLSLILISGFLLRILFTSTLSPYWEEVALGYDSFSIAETLRDHHGNFLPLVAFESFGDDKPAGYFYLAAMSVKVLGLSVFAVRLPSVVAGCILIVVMYWLMRELLLSIKVHSAHQEVVSLFAALLIAINPWAIHFSRTAWEVNVATLFIACGMCFGLKLQRIKQQKELLLTGILALLFFVLSMYTYHAARVIAPFLTVLVFSPLLKQLSTTWKNFLVWICFGLVLCLPFFFAWKAGNLTQRFAETSIFSNLAIIGQSNFLREQDGQSLFARVVHHRYILFGREILRNYLSHFSPNFLFVSGDANPRHSTQLFGLFYLTDALLLLLGGIVVLARAPRRFPYVLVIGWLLIGIFPAALTTGTPHALRILPSLPAFIVILTFGWYYLANFISHQQTKVIVLFTAGVITLVQSMMYIHSLWFVYPNQTRSEWQYGYQQLVTELNQLQQSGEQVYVTREQGRPAMYYWFFSKTDPKLVQAAEPVTKKDQGEFLEYQNIHFVDRLENGFTGLLAGSPAQYESVGGGEVLATIVNPSTQLPIWIVFRK